MRKNYYYMLLALSIMGCESTEDLVQESKSKKNLTQTYIINGDIVYEAEITDGSKPKKPIFIYDIPEKINDITETKQTTLKNTEQSTTLNFNYGYYDYTKSGCKIKKYVNGTQEYYTDAGVYGPNPYPQTDGYLVRGYGESHHNTYYGSLVLFVRNKEEKRIDRGGRPLSYSDPSGSAISIEYPFKANVSYEINLTVVFYDNRYLVEKKYSEGFPTVYAQLKDDGIIALPNLRNINLDPCVREGVVSLEATDYVNNTRSYTLDSRGQIEKYINFKFSPTREKKAILISLHPKTSTGNSSPFPINNYTMVLPFIKITEKPFDPTINVEETPDYIRLR